MKNQKQKDLNNTTLIKTLKEPMKCIWCDNPGSVLAKHGEFSAVAVCRRCFDRPGFMERVRRVHQLPMF
ncbi:MAG: hypothetical protein J4F46_09315 [Dehalococcoidia bacterium]|nr:hypothetical protein [Dehalococcoidia bacterium]